MKVKLSISTALLLSQASASTLNFQASAVSAEYVVFKKLNYSTYTYYDAVAACKSFHPAAKLAEPRTDAEWIALQVAGEEVTSPNYSKLWVGSGPLVNSGTNGYRRIWNSGSMVNPFIVGLAHFRQPCLILQKYQYNPDFKVYPKTCHQGNAQYSAICELRYNNVLSELPEVNQMTGSNACSNCTEFASNPEIGGPREDGSDSEWTQINTNDTNTNCLYYRAAVEISTSYIHAHMACSRLHPNAVPAEIRNDEEWNAILMQRYNYNGHFTYWLSMGPENFVPGQSIRKFDSGATVATKYFRANRADIEGCIYLAQGFSKISSGRNWLDVRPCEQKSSYQYTMCELRA